MTVSKSRTQAASKKRQNDSIAIVGAALRLPGNVSDMADFWRELLAGADLVTEVPQDRWGTRFYQHDRRDEPGRSVTFKAGIVSDIGDFDPAFFGISPREAIKMDPQQRILLELAWHAMEDAGIKPSALAGTACGVFVGISAIDYGTSTVDDLAGMNAYSMLGGTLSIAANRISFIYDLHGPSLSIDTACSSSLVALHTACESLRRGESSAALVGGVNLLAHPYPFIGFSQASMLSADGRSKSFAAGANGYVRAEGGAVLLLKSLSDALRDGDRIHAVIRATGTNADGGQKTGITLPSSDGQTRLLKSVIERAGVPASEIDYVEAHGTGTSVGDPIEVKAIGSVYGVARPADSPLPIGSVKSNLGHMEPASGMAGLLKAILCLKHRLLPPSIHSAELNPQLHLVEQNLTVVREITPLPLLPRPLRASVNSFGFGGTNAHVIIEEAPVRPAKASSARAKSCPPLILSARSRPALQALATAYADLIDNQPENYALIAQNARWRREALTERLAVFGKSGDKVSRLLRDVCLDDAAPLHAQGMVLETALPSKTTRCAFVYSGNGAQWLGMGLNLIKESPKFARELRTLDRLIAPLCGFSILKELSAKPEKSRMDDTAVAQPLLFAIQVALTQMMWGEGVIAEAYAGHSVGEIAAAWASGYLSLDQAILVVVARSHAQSKTQGSGCMMAIGIGEADFLTALQELDLSRRHIEIAGFNAPRSLTVVGSFEALTQLSDHLTTRGTFARMLPLDYAFHSQAMDSIQTELMTALDSLQRQSMLSEEQAPKRFVSTVTGSWANKADLDAHYWWLNVREPVQFAPAIQTLLDDGFNLFVEIGPHAILQRYITQTAETKRHPVRVLGVLRQDADHLADAMSATGRILLHTLDHPAQQAKRPRHVSLIDLPKYIWQKQRYWTEETPEGYNLIQRIRIHPLLGYPLPGVDNAWENVLDTTVVPYLADHVVDGAVVMPGAGYIDMALAAARFGLSWQHIELRDLEIRHPLVFDAAHSRTLRFLLDSTNYRFVIQSRARLSIDEWTEHAVGQLRQSDVTSVLEAISSGPVANLRTRTGSAHYAEARQLGLQYGPAFQGLDKLILGGADVLGVVALPQMLADDAEHIMHPALLDLCFQALLALVAEHNPGQTASWLPVQVGRLRLAAPRSDYNAPVEADKGFTRLVTQVQGKIKRLSPHSVVADFAVLARDGRVLATLQDCRFRAAHFAAAKSSPPLWSMIRQPIAQPRAQPYVLGAESPIEWLPPVQQLSTDFAALIPVHPLRQRYHAELRPLLDALVTSYAFAAVRAHADASGRVTVATQRSQANLFTWVCELLEEQGYLAASQNAWQLGQDEPTEGALLWQMIVQDYPEANLEATLVARFGQALAELFSGQIDLDGIKARFAHSALLRQWQGGNLARVGLERLNRGLLACVADSQASSQTSSQASSTIELAAEDRPSVRLLQIGGDPWFTLNQLKQSLPNLRVYLVATTPSSAEFDQWQVQNHSRGSVSSLAHLELRTWSDWLAEPLTDLSPQDRFQLLIVDGADIGEIDALSVVAKLAALCATHGYLSLGLPGQALYLDWLLRCQEIIDEPDAPTPHTAQAFISALTEYSDKPPLALFEPDDELHMGASLQLFMLNAASAQVARPHQPSVWRIETFSEDSAVTFQSELVGALRNQGDQVILSPLPSTARATASAKSVADIDKILVVQGNFTNNFAGPLGIDLLAAVAQATQSCLARLQVWAENAEERPIYVLLPGGALDERDDEACHPVNAAIWGMLRVAMNEWPNLNITMIDPRGDQLNPGLVHNLVSVLTSGSDEREWIVTPTGIHHLRLVPHQSTRKIMALEPASRRYRLGFKVAGQLRNLKWQAQVEPAIAADEVEISVKAVGLNFRDVMFAMGLLGDEAVENGFSGATLGLECAGVVTRVGADVAHVAIGDSVLGFGPQCFAGHVITRGHAVAKMPAHWSFNEAATVPTVFFTVYYSLVEMGRLRPGERVLIHGAAGGVGIAAVQLAKHLGAEIYATAGSDEKRDFLKLMGVKHIYSSRDLAFAEQIMADTQGEGVDVVLNSLAGEAISRNFDVLRPFGRFLELGKRDFYENTHIGLRPFKDNISYFGIDADQLMAVRPDLTARVFQETMTLFDQGVLHPLPYQEFDANGVVDAFRTMQQARQIGKVVVNLTHAPADIEPLPQPTWRADAEGAYLVTGGLTGFGFATAHWLLKRGAGQVVLTGRRGQSTPDLVERLATLGELQQRVRVEALDVTNGKAVQTLISKINKGKNPLRGVIHAAMVLDDALLQNLTPDRLDAVIAPKVAGAWNLHNATKGLTLDCFVMYSSVTTMLGNAGQANYVAANAALEALSRYRRGTGEPATALCWGPISDVGYLTEHQAVLSGLEARTGGSAITSEQALTVLGLVLGEQSNGLGVMALDRGALERILPESSLQRFDLLPKGRVEEVKPDGDVRAHLQSLPEAQARQMIEQIISQEVALVLGLPATQISSQQSLYDMGLDSLMAVELALGIEKQLGVRLSAMALNEGPTVVRLADRLMGMLIETEDSEPATPSDDAEMLAQIVKQHADSLTDEEKQRLLDSDDRRNQPSNQDVALHAAT